MCLLRSFQGAKLQKFTYKERYLCKNLITNNIRRGGFAKKDAFYSCLCLIIYKNISIVQKNSVNLSAVIMNKRCLEIINT